MILSQIAKQNQGNRVVWDFFDEKIPPETMWLSGGNGRGGDYDGTTACLLALKIFHEFKLQLYTLH